MLPCRWQLHVSQWTPHHTHTHTYLPQWGKLSDWVSSHPQQDGAVRCSFLNAPGGLPPPPCWGGTGSGFGVEAVFAQRPSSLPPSLPPRLPPSRRSVLGLTRGRDRRPSLAGTCCASAFHLFLCLPGSQDAAAVFGWQLDANPFPGVRDREQKGRKVVNRVGGRLLLEGRCFPVIHPGLFGLEFVWRESSMFPCLSEIKSEKKNPSTFRLMCLGLAGDYSSRKPKNPSIRLLSVVGWREENLEDPGWRPL